MNRRASRTANIASCLTASVVTLPSCALALGEQAIEMKTDMRRLGRRGDERIRTRRGFAYRASL